MEEVGVTLHATNLDGDRTRAYFRWRQKVESPRTLEETALEGVPAEVGARGNLGSELAY